jgi:hypothetical protein
VRDGSADHFGKARPLARSYYGLSRGKSKHCGQASLGHNDARAAQPSCVGISQSALPKREKPPNQAVAATSFRHGNAKHLLLSLLHTCPPLLVFQELTNCSNTHSKRPNLNVGRLYSRRLIAQYLKIRSVALRTCRCCWQFFLDLRSAILAGLASIALILILATGTLVRYRVLRNPSGYNPQAPI